MRIITVNLPVSYIEAIDRLTGDEGLYPSRSELIRVAVREHLIKELKASKSFQQYNTKSEIDSREGVNDLTVKVPLEDYENLDPDTPRKYKTYTIVKNRHISQKITT